MTILVGQTIDKYQIIEEIGQGGMATVYRAYQESLNRSVAMKVLAGHLSKETAFRQRFAREAKAVAQLSHPHVLPIYDYGEEESLDIVYLVTELVSGGTLKDKMGHAFEPHDAVRISCEIASALDIAHQRGIVHRDVKPSNILLTEDGRTLLTDFGIAKMVAGTQYTRTGTSVGTPAYMSPEQAKGEQIDGRSDIYSLGVMLYEMLTGKQPFQGDTPLAVAHQHVFQAPIAPRQFISTIPKRLEKVVLQAMAKKPEDRYSTAAEFARALNRATGRRRLPIFTSARSRETIDPGATEVAQPQLINSEVGTNQAGQTSSTGAMRVAKGVGGAFSNLTVWLLRTLLGFAVVLIVIFVLLVILAFWGSARLLERNLEQMTWHTEYLPIGSDYVLSEKDFLVAASETIAPFALDSVTDLDVDFRFPDQIYLTARVLGRDVEIQNHLWVNDGAPQVQLARLNGIPPYVVGGMLSNAANRGLRTSFADESALLSKIDITETELIVSVDRNPALPPPTATVTPTLSPTETVTPTPQPTSTPTITPIPLARIRVVNNLNDNITLNIGGEFLELATSSEGEFSLPPGTYPYTITVTGALPQVDVVTWGDGVYKWVLR